MEGVAVENIRSPVSMSVWAEVNVEVECSELASRMKVLRCLVSILVRQLRGTEANTSRNALAIDQVPTPIICQVAGLSLIAVCSRLEGVLVHFEDFIRAVPGILSRRRLQKASFFASTLPQIAVRSPRIAGTENSVWFRSDRTTLAQGCFNQLADYSKS